MKWWQPLCKEGALPSKLDLNNKRKEGFPLESFFIEKWEEKNEENFIYV